MKLKETTIAAMRHIAEITHNGRIRIEEDTKEVFAMNGEKGGTSNFACQMAIPQKFPVTISFYDSKKLFKCISSLRQTAGEDEVIKADFTPDSMILSNSVMEYKIPFSDDRFVPPTERKELPDSIFMMTSPEIGFERMKSVMKAVGSLGYDYVKFEVFNGECHISSEDSDDPRSNPSVKMPFFEYEDEDGIEFDMSVDMRNFKKIKTPDLATYKVSFSDKNIMRVVVNDGEYVYYLSGRKDSSIRR